MVTKEKHYEKEKDGGKEIMLDRETECLKVSMKEKF
jgi:hypothetical protein